VRGMLRYVLTAGSMLIVHSRGWVAGEAVNTQVRIRVWDRVQIDSKVWDHAQRVVEGVFIPAGIQTIWSSCAMDDSVESLACSAPTGVNDISLRIYRRSRAELKINGHSRGGTSMLLSPEGGKGIVHVFFDRVTEVSASCKVRLELALGITIAHEIGHVLLPDQGHSLAGIMRAKLKSEDWGRAAQGHLGFTDAQKEMISRGVLTRKLPQLCNYSTSFLPDSAGL